MKPNTKLGKLTSQMLDNPDSWMLYDNGEIDASNGRAYMKHIPSDVHWYIIPDQKIFDLNNYDCLSKQDMEVIFPKALDIYTQKRGVFVTKRQTQEIYRRKYMRQQAYKMVINSLLKIDR